MMWKTAISKIGEDDREVIRGYDLQELVQKRTFVEIVYLLFKGKLPSDREARMLDALLAASIDHGAGAPSASVARATASTGNSLHTAVAAGLLTLGDLHGGAVEGAVRFFQEHLSAKDIDTLVADLKEKKVRIPGFGHKVLKHDARTETLFAVARQTGFFGKHCAFAITVGEALNKISSKVLPLNIDGAMGAIIADMGFDPVVAKAFFLIGRLPGLAAHAVEQMQSGEGVKRVDESEIEYTGEQGKHI